MSGPFVPASFAERYLLARYSTGGVLVDLASGTYFRVNQSAALVCEALRAGGDHEARVAAEFGLSRAEAARVIADVVGGLSVPAVRGTPQGAYHFFPTDGGYVLRHGDRAVLEVAGPDLAIRLPRDTPPPIETQLELYVRALAPKLLFQRGVTVLHASACQAAGKLIAFAGLSGAGKTTTAHAFAKAGAELVSEDLVVFSARTGEADVVIGAEGFIQSWARNVSSQLRSAPARSILPTELTGAVSGVTARLDSILFLDSRRRAGSEFILKPLEEPDALVTLLTHDFLGAVETEAWRRFFATAVSLLAKIDVLEASAPDGVDRLAPAAASYMSNWAS